MMDVMTRLLSRARRGTCHLLLAGNREPNSVHAEYTDLPSKGGHVSRRFRGTSCLHSTLLRNVCDDVPEHTASHRRRYKSSYVVYLAALSYPDEALLASNGRMADE